MASIDRAAIAWTIAIVAVGAGFAVYGLQEAETVRQQPMSVAPRTVEMSERAIVSEMTLDAVALYERVGDAAFDLINTGDRFTRGDLYVFVLDQEGVRIAHGGNPDLVGLQVPNYPDNPVRGTILSNADADGEWVTYNRALPDTHIVQTKHSFVVEYDGMIFGAGYYVDNEHETQLRQNAQYMVEQAIGDYNAHGTGAFQLFDSDPEYHDGELYVFVVRMSDNVLVAHGIQPALIGTASTDIVDVDGVNVGNLLAGNAAPEGAWVAYQWENPADGKIEPKSSWIKSFDGYIFGVGVYNK